MKNILIGSSSTKEGIVKVIGSFWYRRDVTLTENGKIFNIVLGERMIEDYIVVKKGNRYRFEEIV